MNELAKRQHAVTIRGGVELWIDEERVPELEKALQDSTKKFIKVSGQLVNTFEILGVFSPEAVEEKNRRKNGEWKCMKGNWHEKFIKCGCVDESKLKTVTATVEGVGEITYKTEVK
jgi:hypothetical protein